MSGSNSKIEKQNKTKSHSKIEIGTVTLSGNSTIFEFGRGFMRRNVIEGLGSITTDKGVLRCKNKGCKMYEEDGVIHLCPGKDGDSFEVYDVNILIKSDTELVLDGRVILENENISSLKMRIKGYPIKIILK